MEANTPQIHEEPQAIDGSPSEAWSELNLLSLDGGGIRGYWTLLVLSKLMEYIAAEEERAKKEGAEEDGAEEDDGRPPVCSSFSPKPYPENVSHVPLSEEEITKIEEARDATGRCRAKEATRRYLPCHYFDYICGSSTGALIAIMLARFRMPVKDCIDEYEKLGEKVFGDPRHFTELNYPFIPSFRRTKYNADKLKKVFEEVTNRRNRWTTDETRDMTFPTEQGLCKVFVTSLMRMSDKPVETLHLLRSYDHIARRASHPLRGAPRSWTRQTTRSNTGRSSRAGIGGSEKPRRTINYGNAQNFEIWEIARAATAAPWYFDEFKIPTKSGSTKYMVFTDGGFSYTNNPTGQGVSEIKEAYGRNSVGIVVSIGTARRERGPRKSLTSRLKSKISQVTDPEVVHQDMLGAHDEDGSGFIYHRLNTTGPSALDVELDEWKPTGKLRRGKSGSATLHYMKTSFNSYLAHHLTQDKFRDCAAELVARRKARANNDALWERYATGAKFACDHEGCNQEVFINHDRFKDHLISNANGKHKVDITKIDDEIERCKTEWRYKNVDGS